jgi:hypothetical protein
MHIEHDRVTYRGQALQSGVRKMVGEYTFTHWLTLNFHQCFCAEKAKLRLKLWTMNVQSRMFRSRQMDPCDENPFLFFAFPENTKKSQPHFHLMVRLVKSHFDYFERVAAPMWTKLVPSGTAYLVPIGNTALDHHKVGQYATKQFNRACSHDEFFVSTMLVEPVCSFNEGKSR